MLPERTVKESKAEPKPKPKREVESQLRLRGRSNDSTKKASHSDVPRAEFTSHRESLTFGLSEKANSKVKAVISYNARGIYIRFS